MHSTNKTFTQNHFQKMPPCSTVPRTTEKAIPRSQLDNEAFDNQDLLVRLERYLDAFLASPISSALLDLEQQLGQLHWSTSINVTASTNEPTH